MTDRLLTLREVARILGLSTPRIYQLDVELEPLISARGTKMKTRMYRLSKVLAFKALRENM